MNRYRYDLLYPWGQGRRQQDTDIRLYTDRDLVYMSEINVITDQVYEDFHCRGILLNKSADSFAPVDGWRVSLTDYVVQPIVGEAIICILIINPRNRKNKLLMRQLKTDERYEEIQEIINRDDEFIAQVNSWYPGLYKCALTLDRTKTPYIYIIDMLSSYRRVGQELKEWGMPLTDERLRIRNYSYSSYKIRLINLFKFNKEEMKRQYENNNVNRAMFLKSCGIIHPNERKLSIPKTASPLIFDKLYHDDGDTLHDMLRSMPEISHLLLTSMSMKYTYATKQHCLLIHRENVAEDSKTI